MPKSFKCADVGMNCGFQTTANTSEQLMPKIAEHAKNAHGLSQIPQELLAKVKAAIKEV